MIVKKRKQFPNDVKEIVRHMDDIVTEIYHHFHDVTETDAEDALEEILSFPQVAEYLKQPYPQRMLHYVHPIYKSLTFALFSFVITEHLYLYYHSCSCFS